MVKFPAAAILHLPTAIRVLSHGFPVRETPLIGLVLGRKRLANQRGSFKLAPTLAFRQVCLAFLTENKYLAAVEGCAILRHID